jgi:hypothetical protein
MRKPPELKKWLNNKALQAWANEAQDLKNYKRRLAIVLTQVHRLYADEIAEVLDVSVSTILSWISKYKQKGPKGFDFEKKGGRRHQKITKKQEKELVAKFLKLYESGEIDSVSDFVPEVSKALCHSRQHSHSAASLGGSAGCARLAPLAQKGKVGSSVTLLICWVFYLCL